MTQQLDREQIIASRDRLIVEGFDAGSFAIQVHDRLLEMMESGERHTEAASGSIRDLQAECEKRGEEIERLKRAAVTAVEPLEALRWSGASNLLSDQLQTAINKGIAAVREAIGRESA